MVTTVFTLAGVGGDPNLVASMLRGEVTAGQKVVPLYYQNWGIADANVVDGSNVINDWVTGTAGQKILMGHSMGALAIVRWLNDYAPTSSVPPSELSCVLLGNSMRPNFGYYINDLGKSLAQVTGLEILVTPSDCRYTVTDIARQYDGWADEPKNLNNLNALTNMQIGMNTIHPNYNDVSLHDETNLTYTVGNTTYLLNPTDLLPMVDQFWYTPDQKIAQDQALRPGVESAFDRSMWNTLPPLPTYAPTPLPLTEGDNLVTADRRNYNLVVTG
jgi:hypothetical protein